MEQYEQAMKNKVEKEFYANFKSLSQMVPCVTTYEMKKFQSLYTISKFKEVQVEFISKVYCDLIFVSKAFFGIMYEIWKDVVCGGWWKNNHFLFHFIRRKVCSYRLFEFWGIICWHTITVLIRNDIVHLEYIT